MRFQISEEPVQPDLLKGEILNDVSGAFASFEGWVRNHNDGKPVNGLEYSAYVPLAEKEGQRIINEAFNHFDIESAVCVHRVGELRIGDIAVFVGATAAHRSSAFEACRYIIDETKARVPIWKRERYLDGPAEWVNCPTNTPR